MLLGVTLVDISEKGILKVKGLFDKIEMGSKLREIDNSISIIIGRPMHSVMIPPKPKFEVKFNDFDEDIIQVAMEVIWTLPGVTSVEVKGDDVQLGMNEDFDTNVIVTKLKDIDENVTVTIMALPDDVVEVEQLREDFVGGTEKV
ncbi:hypothetical protein CARUB_v10027330mg [Capsella rubella]|uniref:HMA domain-containing protein n=1 Tax=Capsella rubella TaxID=81985 RepID=R0GP97_9BRAS|nr:hypothetical protein CARUB_v10027330mg [Capsella rubella]